MDIYFSWVLGVLTQTSSLFLYIPKLCSTNATKNGKGYTNKTKGITMPSININFISSQAWNNFDFGVSIYFLYLCNKISENIIIGIPTIDAMAYKVSRKVKAGEK